MKKIIIIFSTAFLLIAFLAVTAFKPLPASGPSANGQGTLTVGGLTRHFAFHANTMPNGDVQGSGELTYTAGGTKIMFDITCMVVTGNHAAISGVITGFPDDPTRVGNWCYFETTDNGQGNNASPDQLSLLFYNFGTLPCGDYNNGGLMPITGGNIQVKP